MSSFKRWKRSKPTGENEFKKARQVYLELQFKDRTRDIQDDEPDEVQERETFAEVSNHKPASS